MLNQNEQVIEDFLEGKPRSDVWRELRETLEARLKDAVQNRDSWKTENFADPRLPALERKIKELREQVAALEQEEIVTRFVEDSVRATLARPYAYNSDDEFEEEY